MTIEVTQFFKKTTGGLNSFERLFDDVRANLSKPVVFKVRYLKFYSRGIFPRIMNILYASMNSGSINHITGDVHYISYLLKRKKTILTIHDCGILAEKKSIKQLIFWLIWFWIPEKRCEVITTVSNFSKSEIVKYLKCDPDKIVVIHNSLSPEFLFSEKSFSHEKPRILHIGTAKNKNLKRHINALEGIDCKFVVIGQLSPLDLSLLEYSSLEYENLNDLSRDEVLDEYRRSDIVLFCSTYEGFGFPIIEAQSVGRPVITSNICSMPEIAGEGAILVNPYSISEIRLQVLKLIRDQDYRSSIVQKGLINVQRFNAVITAEKYYSIYEKISQKS